MRDNISNAAFRTTAIPSPDAIAGFADERDAADSRVADAVAGARVADTGIADSHAPSDRSDAADGRRTGGPRDRP